MNGHGARILVSEDNESQRNLLAHLLQKEGYEVYRASDGFVALRQMFQRVFDVVITDWEMPRLNGPDFLRHSRLLWPTTPVIIVSAHIPTSPGGIPEGAFAWIRKPYQSKSLLQIVHRAVDASLHLSGEQTTMNHH
ncbi:response regulator [Petrachloros mirabilis]